MCLVENRSRLALLPTVTHRESLLRRTAEVGSHIVFIGRRRVILAE